MSRFAVISGKVWNDIVRSVREFPLEALLGLTYFVLFISGNKIEAALKGTEPFNLILWFFPQYVLVYTLHRFSERKPALKVLYVLSWFLWIPLLLWCSKITGWSLGIAYLLAVILLIIGKETLDNEPYGRNILDTVTNVAAGFIIGFLLLIILDAIIASTNFLFNLDLDDKWLSYPFAFTAFVIIPLLCCSFVARTNYKVKYNDILQVAVDYILSPALVIYAAILYIYIIRIIFSWELPNGGVAYLVASFMIVALICHLLRLQAEKRHFEWFYKAFPAIAAAPLILLWVGVFRRIVEYGLTEARFYLIILSALLTIFTAMLLREKTRRFQLMTLILAISAILFTYIPGIRAKDFGIRSQKARLERALPAVLINGKLPEAIDYEAIQADPQLNEAWLAVDGAYSYLKKNMPQKNFKAIQSDLGEYSFMRWKIGDVSQSAVASWSIRDITDPVDLGEYNLLVPPSGYHYYEDSTVAIFYKDSTKTEELLRCEIRKALDSPDGDPLSKLVYKNEDYMAIFDMINDFRQPDLSFSTGNSITLLKRSR